MKEKTYLPEVRDILAPDKHDLISKSPEGTDTPLISHVDDDIAVNNIAWQEFDYTQPLFKDDDESDSV